MNEQRKCVGCGEFKTRENLIRIMKTDKDGLVVNPNSKTFGRSAYLCYNQSCIELALKKSKINKEDALDVENLSQERILLGL